MRICLAFHPMGQDELAAAKARQDSCIRRFLGTNPDEETPPAKQQFRVATCRFLSAIDNALRVVIGHGIERFSSAGTKVDLARPNKRDSVRTWVEQPLRSLSISADQASCGPSGVSF